MLAAVSLESPVAGPFMRTYFTLRRFPGDIPGHIAVLTIPGGDKATHSCVLDRIDADFRWCAGRELLSLLDVHLTARTRRTMTEANDGEG